MEIRKAEISDLANLSILFDAYRQFYLQQSNIAGSSVFVQERLKSNDSVIFLAVIAFRPVGFVQLYPSFSSVMMRRIYILNDLYVDPEERKRGVATALLGVSERFAAEADALRLTLATEVKNVQAQALYEKLGWQRNEAFLYYNKTIGV